MTRVNSVDHDALQRDLRGVAVSFLIAGLTTPLGMKEGPASKTRDQRTRWLRTQIVNPATTLLDALSDTSAPMLSEWPETMNAPAPDHAVLRAELRKLIDRTDELIAVLNDRKRDGSGFTTEFRADLANALTKVFEKHFPDQRAARDGYDKTTIVDDGSAYARFLRLCTEEIFPNDAALSGRIIDDITKMRGNR